jgi:hypothetical protein
MTSNEISLNHTVVDLVESYKFRINFISIQIHKKITIFKNRLTLTAMGRDGCSDTVSNRRNRRGPWRFAPTAIGHGGGRFDHVLLQNE